MVEENVRQLQEVEFFFFNSPRQIAITRKFTSYFIVITNTTFNIN